MSDQRIVTSLCSDLWCKRKDTYLMAVHCGLCQWEGEIRSVVGHEPNVGWSGERCPRCECKRLILGAFVAREEMPR